MGWEESGGTSKVPHTNTQACGKVLFPLRKHLSFVLDLGLAQEATFYFGMTFGFVTDNWQLSFSISSDVRHGFVTDNWQLGPPISSDVRHWFVTDNWQLSSLISSDVLGMVRQS